MGTEDVASITLRKEKTEKGGESKMEFRKNVRAAMSGWRLGAIFLGLLATALVVLGIAEYYGYIGASLIGTWTYGELIILGIVAAIGAVACEVASKER
jgi:TM2 domain-containing membrane protein YozV